MDELKSQLKQAESTKHGNYYEKAKFMEGAAWMTEKVESAVSSYNIREKALLEAGISYV